MSDRLDSDFLFIGMTGAWVGAIVACMAGILPYIVLLLLTMGVAVMAWIPRSLSMTEIALQGGIIFGALLGTIAKVIPWGIGIHAAIMMVVMVWRQFGTGFGRLRATPHLIVLPVFLIITTGLFFNMTYSDFCMSGNSDVCANPVNWQNGNPTIYDGCQSTCAFTPLAVFGSSVFSFLFVGSSTTVSTSNPSQVCTSATIPCFSGSLLPSTYSITCSTSSTPPGGPGPSCYIIASNCYLPSSDFYCILPNIIGNPTGTFLNNGASFSNTPSQNGVGQQSPGQNKGDVIGFFGNLFSSQQSTLTIVTIAIGLVLIFMSLGIGFGASFLATGVQFSTNEAGTRMAQSLGVGLVLFGLVYGAFGGFFNAFGPSSTFDGVLGNSLLVLLASVVFYGFFQQGKSTT